MQPVPAEPLLVYLRTRYSPAFRLAVPLVLLVGLGLSVWQAVVGPIGVAAGPPAARTPVEDRQQDILRAAIDEPGDPELLRRYFAINTRHFNGQLPLIPVAWEPRLEEVGSLAAQAFTLDGMFGHVAERAVILLHPRLQSDEDGLTRALCHEMVHAYLHTLGVSSADHGPAYRAELARLAREGAFRGIVASTTERSALRAWLDREAERLEWERTVAAREHDDLMAEAAALERAFANLGTRVDTDAAVEAGEVEALGARRDAYMRRVADAQASDERRQREVEAFEREVERYNLMLLYPDGLDESGSHEHN